MLEWKVMNLTFKLKLNLLAWQERTSAYTLHTWCVTKVSSKRGAFGSNRSQTQHTTNMVHTNTTPLNVW